MEIFTTIFYMTKENLVEVRRRRPWQEDTDREEVERRRDWRGDPRFSGSVMHLLCSKRGRNFKMRGEFSHDNVSLETPVQISPLTVTLFTVTPRLQWHFWHVPNDWFVTKLPKWQSGYSDTFPMSQGCHCKWGKLYFTWYREYQILWLTAFCGGIAQCTIS